MELFSKERIAISFDRVTLRQTKDGDKVARMRFAVRLEGDALSCLPPEIRAAFEATDTRENKITAVELDKEINGVNVDFYAMPDSRSVSAALQSINLTKLSVERDEPKGRSVPHLLFTVEIPVDDKTKLRYWLVDNVFGQLWAHFEAAQMTLIAPSAAASAENRVN